MQKQNTVTVHCSCKQLLPFDFVEQIYSHSAFSMCHDLDGGIDKLTRKDTRKPCGNVYVNISTCKLVNIRMSAPFKLVNSISFMQKCVRMISVYDVVCSGNYSII